MRNLDADFTQYLGWAMQTQCFSGLPLIGILAVIYFIAGKLGWMLASLHASALDAREPT